MLKTDPENKVFPWGHSRRFNSYPEYFRAKFGTRVQKVTIDAGFTCPNRDGTRGTGGCIYCLNKAFNPSYCHPGKSVTQQLSEGIPFLRHRYRRAVSYLAYFQAFSNTFAPVSHLEQLYLEALKFPGVKGLIIGTRPDCIDNDKLKLLKDLSRDHYVAVEYGIESCYNKTLSRINRGHTFEESVAAIKLTSDAGLNTGAHFIFGLPGESLDEMLDQAQIISELPLTTVKFHQLQVIRGTQLAADYLKDPSGLKLFTAKSYLEFIIKFLERFNPAIVVERFTGEAPPRFVLSEGWGIRTDQFGILVEKQLEELGTWQGRLYRRGG